ncbi:unnamed protein product [Klebsiella pneumoniae]|nr:unnamed protein product [Klebsiella pneumoniae]
MKKPMAALAKTPFSGRRFGVWRRSRLNRQPRFELWFEIANLMNCGIIESPVVYSRRWRPYYIPFADRWYRRE